MKPIIIVSTLVLAALMGCSLGLEGGNSPRGRVALEISGEARVMASRASHSSMPAGYHLGIYVPESGVAPTSGMVAPAVNREYISDGSSLVSTPPTYLELTKNYDIYGYSPFRSSISDPEAIEFLHGQDVLWAPRVMITGVSDDNCSASLAFAHLTSQVTFKVVIDPLFDSDDDGTPDQNPAVDAQTSITVTGFAEKATLRLSNGALTIIKGVGQSISATAQETVPGEYTLTTGAPVCFFAPLATPMPLTVKVTYKDIIMTGIINRTWVAGESYTYTVTATKNQDIALLGLNATITDWVDVSRDVIVR